MLIVFFLAVYLKHCRGSALSLVVFWAVFVTKFMDQRYR